MGDDREALVAFLRDTFKNYVPEPYAIFRKSRPSSYPLTLESEEELTEWLKAQAYVAPLPKEPAALANIIEVSIVDYLFEKLHERGGTKLTRGTERGYPDLELQSPKFGGDPFAVDVKVAKRKASATTGKVNALRTQSRITLYTGNTYFRYPSLKWNGILRPFGEYAGHIDILFIYTFDESHFSRMKDVEIIVQESWRIASRERSSTTREYIGAVDDIEKLRKGKGAFSTEEEFYSYWRKYPFKTGRNVENELRKLIAKNKSP